MIARQRPVGSAEQAVLRWLAQNDGRWTDADGSVWESKFWTVQLLSTLVLKGLVTEVVAGAHYVLNDTHGTPQSR